MTAPRTRTAGGPVRYCRVVVDADGTRTLALGGRWRLDHLEAIRVDLDRQLRKLDRDGTLCICARGLEALDTAGANLLVGTLRRAGRSREQVRIDGLDTRHRGLVDLVWTRGPSASARLPRAPASGVVRQLGRATYSIEPLVLGHVRYMGYVTALLAGLVPHPSRLRWRECLVQCRRSGLDAIPVVMLITFLIGIVIAYLLGLQAEKYGASVFVIDGVALGMVREFSPMLTAMILAGRSGASFTAQLGTMRLTEETDAIRMLGLSAEQVLVVPRVLGLMITMPLLVFVGDIAGLVGAAGVCSWMLELTPATFVDRLHTELDWRHYVVGLAKAPVFAFAVSVIACHFGMTANRDTKAIGEATTSTVVQSIVAVIVLDALFAVVLQLMEI
ncbi:MAG: ABC transporter permease [Lautropia sp.]